MVKEKYIGSSKISERPKKPLIFKLGEGVKKILSDLQNQIDSFNAHGLSVSNHFGNDKHIGISQYALTQAINRIWQKIDDMTGEVTQGIGMTVTPEYYIGEEGCSVHIVADSYDAHGIFEVLDLYVIEGDEERHIYHGEDVEHHASTVQISDTAYVKCKAQILGIEYEVTKKITHYASFWLGAGASYSDVMTNAHLIPASRHMRGAYDITANGGDRIFVIVGESLAQGFIRADMNGIEIAMTESTITKDGNTYKVFTSQDTYQAGTYNIDING